ncbi:hypothetical protein QR680_004475 [Steinernema hermaphroditum]|uniref:Uncharacterized protein n=1 Tax=Steinernema hermaphroditum TaxID=289476 RepID=A0AA39LU18_9BILA|nr:hypothetical protein QR680_004475 [Steinernema hermaphroditum]
MDDLPANFLDDVFFICYSTAVRIASDLTGTFGGAALLFCQHLHCVSYETSNVNRISKHRYSISDGLASTETVLPRYVGCHWLVLRQGCAQNKDVSVPRDAFARKNARSILGAYLYTADLGSQWTGFLLGCRRLTNMHVHTEFEGSLREVFSKMVYRKQLTTLCIHESVFIDGRVIGLVINQLSQKQFRSLTTGSRHLLLAILELWKANPNMFNGKHVDYENLNGVRGLTDEFTTGLHFHEETNGRGQLFRSRSECFMDTPSHIYKLAFSDIETAPYAAYVIFDCKGKEENVGETEFFLQSSKIHFCFGEV